MRFRQSFLLMVCVTFLGLVPYVHADGFAPRGAREFARHLGIGGGPGYHAPPCDPKRRAHYNRVTGQTWSGYDRRYTEAVRGAQPGGWEALQGDWRDFQGGGKPMQVGRAARTRVVKAVSIPDRTYFHYPTTGSSVIHDCASGDCGGTLVWPDQGNEVTDQIYPPAASRHTPPDVDSDAYKSEVIEPNDNALDLQKLPPVVEDLREKKDEIMVTPVPEPPASTSDADEARVSPLLDPYHPRSASLAPLYESRQESTYLRPVPAAHRPAQGL